MSAESSDDLPAEPDVPAEPPRRMIRDRVASVRDRVTAFERLSTELPPGIRDSVPPDVADKLTERARRSLHYAVREARRFDHNYIGTEHLLLGLLDEAEGMAAKLLNDLGIHATKVRHGVEVIIGRGDRPGKGDISLTPRAKRALNLAIDEARRLNHNYIGTEHVLLGLLREGEGVAAGVLETLGVNLSGICDRLVQMVADPSRAAEPMPASTKDNVVTCRVSGEDLAAIDMLVEAGIRSTRSDAAQWLIHAGVKANQQLFDEVGATVAEIRRLRDEARKTAWKVAEETEAPGDSARE